MVKSVVLVVWLMHFMYDLASTTNDPYFDAQATENEFNYYLLIVIFFRNFNLRIILSRLT
jgi:predicted RNA-binding protein with PUA-like domain